MRWFKGPSLFSLGTLATLAVWLLALAVIVLTVPGLKPGSDYQGTFYRAGAAILEHRSPYFTVDMPASSLARNQTPFENIPYNYPPAFALVIAPLSALPYRLASTVFYWANVVLLVVTALLIAYGVHLRERRLFTVGAVFAALVSFVPIREALALGQVDIVVLALVTAALTLYGRTALERQEPKKPWQSTLAGLMIGIATVFKIYPGIFLLIMLGRRQYRLVAAALVGLVVPVTLAIAVSGPQIMGGWLRASQMASAPNVAAFPWRFGILSVAYRLLTHTPYTTRSLSLPPTVIEASVLLAALAVGVAVIMFASIVPRISPSHLVLVVAGSLAFFPLLETQHLSILMAVLPSVVLSAEGGRTARLVIGKLAIFAIAGSLLLALLNLAIPGRPLVMLTLMSALIFGIAGLFLVRRLELSDHLRIGVMMTTAAFLLVASPAFVNMTVWWGVPMTRLHVLMGEFPLFLLGLLVVGSALISHGGIKTRSEVSATVPSPGVLSAVSS